MSQRARWTIIATACLLLLMCLLLVGVTLRMAPLIDDMGESNIHYLLKFLSRSTIDVETNTQLDECSLLNYNNTCWQIFNIRWVYAHFLHFHVCAYMYYILRKIRQFDLQLHFRRKKSRLQFWNIVWIKYLKLTLLLGSLIQAKHLS